MISYAVGSTRTHLVENRGLKTLCGLDLEHGDFAIVDGPLMVKLPPTCSNCTAVQTTLANMRASLNQ